MKRWLQCGSSVVLIILSIAALLGLTHSAAAADGEIVISMIAPVTGPGSAEGERLIKAAQLAVKHNNEAGGINGKKIKFVIQDNQSTNPGALAALEKSLEQDKALALLGPVKSTQILAMSDAVKNAAVPMMIGGTNVTLTKSGNPWLFRCRPDDGLVALGMVKYIKEDMNRTKVGIIHDADAFGTGGADNVEKGVKENGLTLVRREKYTSRDKDFTPQLLAMKSAGAEVVVFFVTNPEDAATLQRQYRQLNMPYGYIGSQAGATNTALDLSKDLAEGLLHSFDWVPDVRDVSKRYAESYRKAYGVDMDAAAAWNYDAINILVNAIRKAGEDRAKIRDAILATKNYEGVIGTFAFTPNGDGMNSIAIIKIASGKHEQVKVVDMAPK